MKRLSALCLAALILCSLTACSGKSGNSRTSEEPQPPLQTTNAACAELRKRLQLEDATVEDIRPVIYNYVAERNELLQGARSSGTRPDRKAMIEKMDSLMGRTLGDLEPYLDEKQREEARDVLATLPVVLPRERSGGQQTGRRGGKGGFRF